MQKVRPTMCFIAHCNDVFLLFNQVYQLILDHQDHQKEVMNFWG